MVFNVRREISYSNDCIFCLSLLSIRVPVIAKKKALDALTYIKGQEAKTKLNLPLSNF
jgi:hypothetical protein